MSELKLQILFVGNIFLYGSKIHLVGFVGSPVGDSDMHGDILSSSDYWRIDSDVTVMKARIWKSVAEGIERVITKVPVRLSIGYVVVCYWRDLTQQIKSI